MKQFVENMSDKYFIQEEPKETLKHLKLLVEKSRVWNPLVPQVHLLELESQPQQHIVSHPISQFIISLGTGFLKKMVFGCYKGRKPLRLRKRKLCT